MKILVFAPHPDDEVLGCGGYIAKHASLGDEVYVCVVTKGVSPLFLEEDVCQTRREQKKAHEILGIKTTIYLDFPAVMLEEQHRYEINRAVKRVVDDVQPSIVLMPHFGDMQKDHAIVSESIMVACRPRGSYTARELLSYETLSETEWNIPHVANAFIANCYVDISDTLNKKTQALSMFESQIGDFPNPRSIKAVEALAQLRGSTIGVKAAEAFCMIRKID